MTEIYELLPELIRKGIPCAVCTVTSTLGSTPRKAGSKMIVTMDKTIYGTIGGGILENHIIEKCPDIIAKSSPELIKLNLSKDLGMKCGGYAEVFIEPVSTPFKLMIFGGGHIGRALSEIAVNLNFITTLIDDRPDIIADYTSNSITLIADDYEKYLENAIIDSYTFLVVVTKGHESDLKVLNQVIKKPFAYLGVIGSKRKAAELKKNLTANNFATEEEFARVHIPIGTPILAEGPFEIAVSIASELILEKNKLLKAINNIKE